MDKEEGEKIFKSTKARTMCKNIKFSSWISERGEEPCPLLIGLKSEDEKRNLMKKARDLQKTEYNDVTIGHRWAPLVNFLTPLSAIRYR